MKALSLWNPWAVMMAKSLKLIETRSRPISHRGPLVICSTIRTPSWVFNDLQPNEGLYWKTQGFSERWETLPSGVGLCVVEVYGCVPTESLRGLLSLREANAGDYTPGRFAIMTRDCRPFFRPIPCKGKQGLWEFPDTEIQLAEVLR